MLEATFLLTVGSFLLTGELFYLQFCLGTLVAKRFATQRFADSRESTRTKKTILKHLARFARITFSLRFAFQFA